MIQKIFIILSLFILCLNFSCSLYKDKDYIIQGIDNLPKGLDPALNYGVTEVLIFSQIYETLLLYNKEQNILMPWLADKWEKSKNNDEFIFNLRPNVYFQDGSLMTAEAVKYSFDRQLKLRSTSPLLNMIDSIAVSDSLSIKFILKFSYALFPYVLSSPIGLLPISKRALIKYKNSIDYHPVGTGPFKLKKWLGNQEIILISNENYWGKQINKVGIHFKSTSKVNNIESAIQNQKIDILYFVTGFSSDRLKWLGKIDYKVISPLSTLFIGFNLKDSLFNNLKVRKGILRSINIPRLVLSILRGNSMIAKGPLPPSLFNYENIGQDSYNIKQAKKLLKEAGFKGEIKIKFFYPKEAFIRNTIFELIKADLAKIGITLDIIPFNTWEEHNEACKSDSAQMFISGWRSEVLGEPENFLHSLFYSRSEYNVLHYENPNVDLWLEQVRRQPNRKERDKLYQKIVRTILDDTPAIFLYHVKPHFAYNKEKIKYLPVNPYGIIQYHQIILNN